MRHRLDDCWLGKLGCLRCIILFGVPAPLTDPLCQWSGRSRRGSAGGKNWVARRYTATAWSRTRRPTWHAECVLMPKFTSVSGGSQRKNKSAKHTRSLLNVKKRWRGLLGLTDGATLPDPPSCAWLCVCFGEEPDVLNGSYAVSVREVSRRTSAELPGPRRPALKEAVRPGLFP